MMATRRLRNDRGQSTLEYAILIAVVIAAILAMQVFAKRAVQGRLKSSADQIGSQWSAKHGSYEMEVKNTGKREDTLVGTGLTTSTVKTEEKSTRALKNAGETIDKLTDETLFE